jgi:hypothetical protein
MYCARHASIITFTKIFESQQFLKVFGSKKTKRRKHGHIYPEGERTLALLMTLFRTCMLDGFVRKSDAIDRRTDNTMTKIKGQIIKKTPHVWGTKNPPKNCDIIWWTCFTSGTHYVTPVKRVIYHGRGKKDGILITTNRTCPLSTVTDTL